MRDRQSHHVEVAALDALDELGSQALDGIRAGLIHRLAAGGVVLDLLGRERREPHAGFRAVFDDAAGRSQADGRQYLVPPAGKHVQHAPGVGGVQRFAQYFALDRLPWCRRQDDLAIGRSRRRPRLAFSRAIRVT
jgi:hypothetical protein